MMSLHWTGKKPHWRHRCGNVFFSFFFFKLLGRWQEMTIRRRMYEEISNIRCGNKRFMEVLYAPSSYNVKSDPRDTRRPLCRRTRRTFFKCFAPLDWLAKKEMRQERILRKKPSIIERVGGSARRDERPTSLLN